MDVIYLKKNGIMDFRIIKDPTNIYRKMDRLIEQKIIPDLGISEITSCGQNGTIIAVKHLLKSQRIIVNPLYLVFKDHTLDDSNEGTSLVFERVGTFGKAV